MKKFLFATTSLAVMSLAAGAHAGGSNEGYTAKTNYSTNMTKPLDEAWYVSVSGVAAFIHDQGPSSFDTGWGGLVVVGHEVDWGFAKGMRAELEGGYRTTNGDLNAYTAMGNVYYDFKNNSPWTPYVGVGIGAAYIEADGLAGGAAGTVDDQDWAFAYQGIAGINYAFTRNWSAQVEYRYFGTTDADLSTSTGASTDYDYDSHNVVAGLKYKFY